MSPGCWVAIKLPLDILSIMLLIMSYNRALIIVIGGAVGAAAAAAGEVMIHTQKSEWGQYIGPSRSIQATAVKPSRMIKIKTSIGRDNVT